MNCDCFFRRDLNADVEEGMEKFHVGKSLFLHDDGKIFFLGNENRQGFLTRILCCNYTKIILNPLHSNEFFMFTKSVKWVNFEKQFL